MDPERDTAARDAKLSIAFLKERVRLSPASFANLEQSINRQSITLTSIGKLGVPGLQQLGCETVVEAARIMAAFQRNAYGRAPTGPNGEPVVIRPKVVIEQLKQVSTITQTTDIRLVVDCYWTEPDLVGFAGDEVPDGVWRPEGIYISNQVGTMKSDTERDRPVLMDRKTGLLMWAISFSGSVYNPMSLKRFPFDSDSLDINIHQAEHSSRDEYVFRNYDDEEDEKTSVMFEFDVWETLGEWDVRGFSKDPIETRGGDKREATTMRVTLHMTRRWQYFCWKVVLPLLACTLFSFSARIIPNDALPAIQSTHMSMFLATSALLYVIERIVPKTPYLTLIDKFVVTMLALQFINACISWLRMSFDNKTMANVELFFTIFLPVALISAVAYFVAWPIYSIPSRVEWPDTLARIDGVKYFTFENEVNIVYPTGPGEPDNNRLKPKVFANGYAKLDV